MLFEKVIKIEADNSLEAAQIQGSLQVIANKVNNDDIVKVAEIITENPKIIGKIVSFIKNPPFAAKIFINSLKN
jgi:hypothetical protein